MNKIKPWVIRNWLYLLPVILLIIFILSIWNKNFHIGGDNVLPLNPPNNIEKSLFVWELENRGVNGWRYMFILWQLPFYTLSLVGIPAYISIKIYIASILVVGFVFTYLLYVTLFIGTKYKNNKLGIFCSLIFVLSGASVDILPTTIFLGALSACSYLLLKYLDSGKFRYIIFFSLAVNYSFFAHLPQAKYLFVLFGELFFILLLYMQVRKVNFRNLILRIINLSILTVLLSAFTLAPFLFDAFRSGGTYNYLTQNVTVYNGDAELHTATLPFVTRLFTSTLVNDVSGLGRFLGNPLFSFWTFFLLAIAFLSVFLVKTKKEKKVVYLCILGFVSFIFLAKGSNPPFGEVYKFLLFNVPLFKVFRTTSMSVIGATIFFAILLTMSMYYLKKKWQKIFIIILLIHVVVFSPIYFGVRLITFEEKGQVKKGFSIPNEYYQMGNKLDLIKQDTKILSLPLDDSYAYKDWPYIGQSIMRWITKKPYIHYDVAGFPGFTDNLVLQRMNAKEACFWTAINNVGYILNEKDSKIADYSLSNFHFSGISVVENSYFKLEKIKPECFLPHVYVATDTILFQGDNNSIPGASRYTVDNRDIFLNINSPINKKAIHAFPQIVIEANPLELSDFSDNSVTKKVFIDLSGHKSLDFLTYKFSIPKAGNYEMIVDNNLVVDKKSKVFKKGENRVKIPLSKSDTLIDYNSFNLFINDKTAASFSQVIKDWEGDAIYLISLSYKAFTPSSITVSVEERERHFNGRLPHYDLNNALFSQELSNQDSGEYQYQAIFKTDINAQEATVILKKAAGDVKIESFDLVKIYVPKVFLTILRDKKAMKPKVVSTKINPTKYDVRVEDVKRPYHLVLSESFSKDWKVYIKTCTEPCSILQEWNFIPIPEERHYVVDGYANGWYIVPSDSKMKANYSVVIEYWPQRLFYVGVIIAILTFLFCLILIVKNIKNE